MFKTRILFFSLLLSLFSFIGNNYAQETPSEEDIIAQLLETTDPVIVESIVSNDGSFSAEVISYPCTQISDTLSEYSLEFLSIQHTETSEIIWQTQQLIGCGGLGTYGFDAIRWIDTYLYYSTSREGSVDGLSFGWTAPLFRYDVAMADAEESLGFAYISPLGHTIVSWQGNSITIGAANSPENATIELEDNTLVVTNILWLPDESGVLVVQADTQFQSTFSVVTFIERETMTQSRILATSE